MPIPINNLFDDENSIEIHCLPSLEDISDMSKRWNSIPVNISNIPVLDFPMFGTKEFSEDLDLLQKYFISPINSRHFLELSDKKPYDILKDYCQKNNLDLDFDKLYDLNDELSSLILTLKFKYNRPRPKKFMQQMNDSFPHERITSNKSPSYPSGHTAHAFFNCVIIAAMHPEHEMRLRSLAEQIGQSRIDLGKHYPSDVSYGRFIGEFIGKKYLNGGESDSNQNVKEAVMTRENRKIARNLLREAASNHDTKSLGTTYTDELCEFIIRSNAIERYHFPISDAYEAAKSFMHGLPVEYCTDNKYIRSHLSGLETASLLRLIDDPVKVQTLHAAMGADVLERGEPGVYRPFEHYARTTGHKYTHPNDILGELNLWCEKTKSIDPFSRHVLYECIHPFSDGNGRSGRLILAADLNFDLANLNDMIGDDYIDKIVDYQMRN